MALRLFPEIINDGEKILIEFLENKRKK